MLTQVRPHLRVVKQPIVEPIGAWSKKACHAEQAVSNVVEAL